ncbi:MAG: hypothetical protein U0Q16_08255 [Bryobacteraceae bacterium]
MPRIAHTAAVCAVQGRQIVIEFTEVSRGLWEATRGLPAELIGASAQRGGGGQSWSQNLNGQFLVGVGWRCPLCRARSFFRHDDCGFISCTGKALGFGDSFGCGGCKEVLSLGTAVEKLTAEVGESNSSQPQAAAPGRKRKPILMLPPAGS